MKAQIQMEFLIMLSITSREKEKTVFIYHAKQLRPFQMKCNSIRICGEINVCFVFNQGMHILSFIEIVLQRYSNVFESCIDSFKWLNFFVAENHFK